MFDHILQKTRTVYWQYGNVTCAGYALDDIDTIGKDGSLNDTSALNIIVRGVSRSFFKKIISFSKTYEKNNYSCLSNVYGSFLS